jgi:hypothetical protein
MILVLATVMLLNPVLSPLSFASSDELSSKSTAEDCGCSGSLPENNMSSKVKKTDKVDEKLIKEAQKHIKKDYFMEENEDKNKDSYKDLLWEEAYIVEYENGKKVITVPFKLNEGNQLQRSTLAISYDTENKSFTAGMIADFIRTDVNDTNNFTVEYSLPNGAPLYTMAVDLNTKEMKVTSSYDGDYYLNLANQYAEKSGNSNGYWSCVGKCLKSAWSQMPVSVQVACEGACGACMWSPAKVVCAGCVVCLASYALGCIVSCA